MPRPPHSLRLRVLVFLHVFSGPRRSGDLQECRELSDCVRLRFVGVQCGSAHRHHGQRVLWFLAAVVWDGRGVGSAWGTCVCNLV
eukprot:9037623-Heterocapsa_arctica.AAC.1